MSAERDRVESEANESSERGGDMQLNGKRDKSTSSSAGDFIAASSSTAALFRREFG